MKHLFDIVDCLVEKDGKFLIVAETGPGREGLYNLPGGHIDEDETIAEAAIRETFEETGYEVELTGFVGLYQTIMTDLNVCGPVMLGSVVSGDVQVSDEHPEVRWVTADEFLELAVQGHFWTSYVGGMMRAYQERGAYPLDVVVTDRR
jgi:phosphatase NudJ